MASWKAKDPIVRLRLYLEAQKLWDRRKEEKLQADTEAAVQAEVDAYEAFPAPNPLDMFAENYALAPRALREQRAELSELLKSKTDQDKELVLPPAEGRFP